MSYCRWSSDDFRCDVYTYEHTDGGWTTHVAARRHEFDETKIPPECSIDEFEAWWDRYQEVMRLIADAELVPIGGPHDGETFDDASPRLAAERLLSLRSAGYRVPQYAIDALLEEDSCQTKQTDYRGPSEDQNVFLAKLDAMIAGMEGEEV